MSYLPLRSDCSKHKQLLMVTLYLWDYLPQVLPAQLLRGGAWVLTLGQASAKFSSWVSVACGWEKTSAGERGLIVLGKTSGAREAEAGWLEKQEAR